MGVKGCEWAAKYACVLSDKHSNVANARLTQQHFIWPVTVERSHALFTSICIHVGGGRLRAMAVVSQRRDAALTSADFPSAKRSRLAAISSGTPLDRSEKWNIRYFREEKVDQGSNRDKLAVISGGRI